MRKVLSFLLIFVFLFSSINIFGLEIKYMDSNGKSVEINDFLDTQGHWAHDIILKVAEYGLIVGSNGNFMPDQPIKRGDLAIIVDRMLNLKTTTYNLFYDLPNDSYYRDSLLKCVAAGYITGVGVNEIDPEGFATREQVAVIISRIFSLDTGNSYATSFKDDSKISSWAKSSVSAMSRLGYINGDDRGYVNPSSFITRAELVTLLNNIANVYIPKKDSTGLGADFRGNYPTNIVTSKPITLTNSIVGRDVVLTHGVSSLKLIKTDVRGRILAMNKSSITIDEGSVSDIILLEGKSSISGVEFVDEIYIAQYASESSLDSIPKRLILESGVRVKIGNEMYENESIRTKTYYANDLQADISDEKGYISGGPKISGVKFEQDMDNTITVSNIRITEGDSKVSEIGVIWLEQEDDENAKNPTYKKNDGRKIYRSYKIDEAIEFEVGEVEGTCAYRVYVKDKDGLYAYSKSTIFTEYNFSTNLKIYDNNYPETLDVEIVFRGNSIPEIGSVRVVYDVDELYSEEHNEIALKLYSDKDMEVQPDPTKYKRYTATIKTKKEKINNEYVFTPPTAFGYIITFRNGTIVNRFPILTNTVPEGVSPMSELITGSAVYNGSTSLTIKNNVVTTRYIVPQEVGIVYKTTNSESVSRPTAGASGWERKSAYVSLDVNESDTFDVSIPLLESEGYTYYSAYVKTSNGYWYGDVKKFNNSVQGDDGGYRILSTDVKELDDTSVLIEMTMDSSKGVPNREDWASLGNLIGFKKLSELDVKIKGNILYFVIDNLETEKYYDIPLYIENSSNLKSNEVMLSFNISETNDIKLTNKTTNNGVTTYVISTSDSRSYFTLRGVEAVENVDRVELDGFNVKVTSSDISNGVIRLKYTYYSVNSPSQVINWNFEKTFKLY